MAIKLRVQENKATFNVRSDSPISFTTQEGIPIYPVSYSGEYTLTPTGETQIFNTEGLMMTRNITVNPIPSNYGLVTYDGSVITIS